MTEHRVFKLEAWFRHFFVLWCAFGSCGVVIRLGTGRVMQHMDSIEIVIVVSMKVGIKFDLTTELYPNRS